MNNNYKKVDKVAKLIGNKIGSITKGIENESDNEKEELKSIQKADQESKKQNDSYYSHKINLATIDSEREGDQLTRLFKEKVLFGEYARVFEGLYESFYQISRKKHKEERAINILKEYKGRISNIPELKETMKFFAYVDNIQQRETSMDEIIIFVKWWLLFLELCGITRDEKVGILEVYNGVSRFYNEEYGEILLVGDRCSITSPYWIKGEIVLEKGRVNKI